MENVDGKYLIHSPTLLSFYLILLHFQILMSQLFIIYRQSFLLQLQQVLAWPPIFLWLSNDSNKALLLNECYSYSRFQPSQLPIPDF